MEFLAIAKDILGFVSTVDFTGVVLLVFLVVFVMMMYRLSKSESSKFFYDQLFVDKDGVASTSKIAHLVVLTVSTWGFVHLTLKGELSEWYFLAYITIWVAQRGFTKWVDMHKPKVEPHIICHLSNHMATSKVHISLDILHTVKLNMFHLQTHT